MEDSDDSASPYSSPFLYEPSAVLNDDEGSSISHHAKNSLSSTVVSYVCTTVGAGIISLPLALAEAGWFGLVIIVITGLVCTQTANWLLACMFLTPHPLTSYEAIGVAAMGRPGKILVALLQNITLFGVCCIFLIIAGSNLASLIPALSMHAWVLIVGVVLIPVSWLKTVKEVKYLAWFGLFASLLVGLVIIITGLSSAIDPPSPPPSRSFFRATGLSTCINIVVFSLGSHSVMPNQVNEMHDARHHYRRFTSLAYLLISSIYCIVAACGYAGYGNSAADNILTTIESSPQPHTHTLTQIARLFITLHVLLAYPLPLNPVCLFAEDSLGILKLTERRQWGPRVVLRSALVVMTVFVASVVPYFGSILSLVSALSIIAVAFILPPVFYGRLNGKEIERREWVWMGVVVVVGVVSCVIGIYYAISGLVKDIRENPNPFDNYWG